jgi:putative transposase
MHPLEPQLRLPATFRRFNPRAAMRVYQRNLPHWRQPGATYFLTFRLGDSLPTEVVDEVRRERASWRQQLEKARAKHGGDVPEDLMDEYQAFLLRTYRRMEKVMDAGHGACMLRDASIRKIVNDALLYFHNQRYEMHSFVVMPNHVHVCVRPLEEWQPEELLKTWKGFIS